MRNPPSQGQTAVAQALLRRQGSIPSEGFYMNGVWYNPFNARNANPYPYPAEFYAPGYSPVEVTPPPAGAQPPLGLQESGPQLALATGGGGDGSGDGSLVYGHYFSPGGPFFPSAGRLPVLGAYGSNTLPYALKEVEAIRKAYSKPGGVSLGAIVK